MTKSNLKVDKSQGTSQQSLLPTSDLWQQANEHHQAAERAALTAIERARQCGDVLIKLKAACKHGEWTGLLKVNFSGSARTAQAYMQLSKRWPELQSKSATAADLTLRDALKVLASPKASIPNAEELNRECDLPEISDGMFILARDDDERHAEVCPSRKYPGFTWVVMYDYKASFIEFLKKPIRAEYVKSVLSEWRFKLPAADRWIEVPIESFNQWYLDDEPWVFRETPKTAMA